MDVKYISGMYSLFRGLGQRHQIKKSEEPLRFTDNYLHCQKKLFNFITNRDLKTKNGETPLLYETMKKI